MAKLTHPGIVVVYDSGETADGMLCIVMEFIEGTDVARMIAKDKRLHTEHAMAITAHVCDALTYAHERGIIHRDIKPANIMVGYDGVVKVADFGLAKMSKGGESGLTQSGMAMGTLYYMAPEALMLGSAVDFEPTSPECVQILGLNGAAGEEAQGAATRTARKPAVRRVWS